MIGFIMIITNRRHDWFYYDNYILQIGDMTGFIMIFTNRRHDWFYYDNYKYET